jgi:FtsZ-binding cell division protein ZapB
VVGDYVLLKQCLTELRAENQTVQDRVKQVCQLIVNVPMKLLSSSCIKLEETLTGSRREAAQVREENETLRIRNESLRTENDQVWTQNIFFCFSMTSVCTFFA